MSSKELKLLEIVTEINQCTACSLSNTPGLHVPGEGNSEAKIVFLGEAPGATEAEKGRPFVGRAGKLLDNMIQSMDLQRSDVYILNVVKCRPPDNRRPLPAEITSCKSFLLKQLEIINPKVIIALGNTALGFLTGKDSGIVSRCGNFEKVEINGKSIDIMPVFHPSALLRNPKFKEPAWYALQKVAKEIL